MSEINKHAYKETMNKEQAIAHLSKVLLDRGKDYGRPRPNHQRMADLMNAYLNGREKGPLKPEDMTVVMILMKVARLMESPQHIDSFLDIAGYAICGLDCIDEEKENEYYDRQAEIQQAVMENYNVN